MYINQEVLWVNSFKIDRFQYLAETTTKSLKMSLITHQAAISFHTQLPGQEKAKLIALVEIEHKAVVRDSCLGTLIIIYKFTRIGRIMFLELETHRFCIQSSIFLAIWRNVIPFFGEFTFVAIIGSRHIRNSFL